MKIINNLKYFISNISFTQPKVLLGRWTVDYCENKINRKIDLSNEDHCGVCNNNINNKTINFKTIDIDNLIFFETI
jgi:hypothetical protein